MTQSLTSPSAVRADNLRARAERFDALLREHATDARGIMHAAIHFDPIRPLQPGDIDSPVPMLHGLAPEDLYGYEDAGMVTGAYLAAQSIRFRVTADPDALRAADAAFAAIRAIYQLGAAKRPGFFPKPYGGKTSDQLSRDQYLFAMTGLTEYLTVAADANRSMATDMLVQMARYWIDIKYTTRYFNLPPSCHLDDFMGSLYLGIMAAAVKASGDSGLQHEYERLRDEVRLGARMRETHAAMFRAGRTYDGAMYYRQSENPVMMKAMAIDLMWDHDPEHREVWREALRTFWEDDLLVPLDRESGLNYFLLRYDADADRAFLTEPGVIEELENPLNLSFLTWGGLRQHAGSTQTAYAAAVIADRLGMPEAKDIAELVLDRLTLEKFRGLTVPDATHIPPGHGFELDLLGSGYVAYWLWTYWVLRERF